MKNGKGNQFTLSITIPDGDWNANSFEVAGILRRLAATLNMNPERTHDNVTITRGDIVGEWEMTDLAVSGWVDNRWTSKDVQSLRPTLSVQECVDVLKAAAANQDANVGINWGVLEVYIDELYGQNFETEYIRDVRKQFFEFGQLSGLGYRSAELSEVVEHFDNGRINHLEYVFRVSMESKFMEREVYDVMVQSNDGVHYDVYRLDSGVAGEMIGDFELEDVLLSVRGLSDEGDVRC